MKFNFSFEKYKSFRPLKFLKNIFDSISRTCIELLETFFAGLHALGLLAFIGFGTMFLLYLITGGNKIKNEDLPKEVLKDLPKEVLEDLVKHKNFIGFFKK